MPRRLPSRLATALLLPLAVACGAGPESRSVTPGPDSRSARVMAPARGVVKTTGDALVVGDGTLEPDPAALHERVATLLKAGRRAEAAMHIRRRPAAALAMLRGRRPDSASAAEALAAFVLDGFDATGGRAWQEALMTASSSESAVKAVCAAAHKARAEALAQLRRGQFEAEAAAPLRSLRTGESTPGSAGSRLPSVLRCELARVEALILVLADRPHGAVEAYGAALAEAGERRLERAHLEALQADALRRDARPAEATRAWQRACALAAAALADAKPLRDPVLWQRLASLRPVNEAWPTEAVAAIRAELLGRGLLPEIDGAMSEAARVESWRLLMLGLWHLDRREPELALLACKRAEALAPQAGQGARGPARLGRARALLALGRREVALPDLIELASAGPERVRRPALALLGSIELQRKDGSGLRRGLGLLTRALDGTPEGTAETWPGRPAAVADLGLARVLNGETELGLACLERAEGEFQRRGDRLGRCRAMRNRVGILRHVGRDAEAEQLEAALAELSARP